MSFVDKPWPVSQWFVKQLYMVMADLGTFNLAHLFKSLAITDS